MSCVGVAEAVVLLVCSSRYSYFCSQFAHAIPNSRPHFFLLAQ